MTDMNIIHFDLLQLVYQQQSNSGNTELSSDIVEYIIVTWAPGWAGLTPVMLWGWAPLTPLRTLAHFLDTGAVTTPHKSLCIPW